VTSIRVCSARGDIGARAFELEQAELLKRDHDQLSKGTRPSRKDGGTMVLPPSDAPTLASLGVSKRESSRAPGGSIDPPSIEEAVERELAEHSESQRAGQRPTAIAEGGKRQAGHRDTVEIPAVTMAELVESRP
jgi:hypothetical protein